MKGLRKYYFHPKPALNAEIVLMGNCVLLLARFAKKKKIRGGSHRGNMLRACFLLQEVPGGIHS